MIFLTVPVYQIIINSKFDAALEINSTRGRGNTSSSFIPWKLGKSTGLIRLIADLASLFERFAPEALEPLPGIPETQATGINVLVP